MVAKVRKQAGGWKRDLLPATAFWKNGKTNFRMLLNRTLPYQSHQIEEAHNSGKQGRIFQKGVALLKNTLPAEN